MVRPYRVVVGKPGLDGHDRGARVVTRSLRDHGFDVVYAGLRQTPARLADLAVREGADAIGLSVHSGAHLHHFSRLLEELRSRGAGDILVFGGGIIPAEDAATLHRAGVAGLFGPGTSLADICRWLRQALDGRAGELASASGDQRAAG